MKKEVKEAELIISAYKNMGTGFMDLKGILKSADKLGVLLSAFIVLRGQALADYLIAEDKYKKRYRPYTNSKGIKNLDQAKSMAVTERTAKAEAQAHYVRLKDICESYQVVLDRMSQRISQLKKEWELNKFQLTN